MLAGVNGWMHMSMGVGADVCVDVDSVPLWMGPLWMGPVMTDALMRAAVCTLMLFGWMPMPSGLLRRFRTGVDADMRMDMGVGACVIVVAGMEAAAKDEGIAAGADALMCVQAGKDEADGISEATKVCPDFHDSIRVHASTCAPSWTRMMMQGINTRMMVPEGGR